MLAVDTNVLVRCLVDDPSAPEQCAAARRLVGEAEAVYLPQVVQVETVWVLAQAYGLSKAALKQTLTAVAQHPAYTLQSPEVFTTALELFSNGKADFADCIILAESRSAGCELATFDRKLGKIEGAKLVA
jgi:predicted nucleic-acid-binding protein